jgi:ACS family hexuronate transporter-like MFS transporter
MQATSKIRWWIFAVLLLINLVNNLDRQVFSLVGPNVQHEFGWNELGFARVVAAFQVAFALASLSSGWLVDRVGVRRGVGGAIAWFSIAQMLHIFTRSIFGFGVARVGLAIGEAPAYPASLKAVAEWAPRAERGVGAGLVHFGVSIGAVVAPLFIPYVAANWGWRSCFLITGSLGLIVLALWLAAYDSPERHKGVSASERELILSTRTPAPVGGRPSWLHLFRRRQLWTAVVLQAAVNPAWWFLVYWLPKFLSEVFQIRGVAVTPYVTAVYAMSAVGALGGGSLSGWFIVRGCTVNQARKITLALCGAVMPTVLVAAYTRNPWLAVAVIGLAAAVHQTWTTTGAAIVADLFAPGAVASVIGIASFFGSISGTLAAEVTGRLLDWRPGHYLPMFVFSGFAYMTAAAIVHLLSPRLEPVHVS